MTLAIVARPSEEERGDCTVRRYGVEYLASYKNEPACGWGIAAVIEVAVCSSK